jgi:protein gp37
MGKHTTIAWTQHTFNPWWGCAHVSPGCENCYAETFDHRIGGRHWGVPAARRFFGDDHWREPQRWNAAAEKARLPAQVFCASFADVFEDRRDLDDERSRLWDLIAITPWLDWQLLTKRPENFDKLGPRHWVTDGWPTNVWLGVTAEDQARAEQRIPILLRTPASVRFVSYEPALSFVDFWPWMTGHRGFGLDWLIVGGESGPGARPFNLSWARNAIEQCRVAQVPVFVKQLGARPVMDDGARIALQHPKGTDVAEWPADLRVRQFPSSVIRW